MLRRNVEPVALALAGAFGLVGCVTHLDMSQSADPTRAATTLPYTGVRGGRQFADYQAIGRSILTGVAPDAKPVPNPKAPKKPGGTAK